MSAEEEDGKFDVGWFHGTVRDFINLAGNVGEGEKMSSRNNINVIKGQTQEMTALDCVSVRGPDSLLQASVDSPSSWQRSDHRVSSLGSCSISCHTVGKKRKTIN